MRRHRSSVAVIGLALGASALTSTASALTDAPAARTVETAAPAATATPLTLRPMKPLALLEESPHTSIGWKLGAVVLIGGFCAWVWKTRKTATAPTDAPSLRILRRTSIGVRSELLVVEMDGQRLLLGVTPSTIQNLYIAPFTDEEEAPARELAESLPPRRASREDFSHRPTAVKVAAPDTSRRQRPDPIEGQALGLRSLVERK